MLEEVKQQHYKDAQLSVISKFHSNGFASQKDKLEVFCYLSILGLLVLEVPPDFHEDLVCLNLAEPKVN